MTVASSYFSPQHDVLLNSPLTMPSSEPVFCTPLTRLFKINHPIMLAGMLIEWLTTLWSLTNVAGMNVAAGPKLAATVTNSGCIGVIGGIRQTPKVLQRSIDELKSFLEDKDAPFGVDLLLPQVGGNARKTNVCPRLPCRLDITHLSCFRSTIIPTVSSTNSLMSLSTARQPCSSAQSEYLQKLLWINYMQLVYLS